MKATNLLRIKGRIQILNREIAENKKALSIMENSPRKYDMKEWYMNEKRRMIVYLERQLQAIDGDLVWLCGIIG